MVTTQKYVVMQAQMLAEDNEEASAGRPTFLKILYLDTSPTFFLPGVRSNKGPTSQVLGEKPISNTFVVNSHLKAGRPAQVAKMVLHVIQEPEQWFTSCMQLVNYMLKNPKALMTHKVQKEVWMDLHRMAQSQE